MAIIVCLEKILKEHKMTSKELCYYLNCDVGDILKFDGNLEEDDSNLVTFVYEKDSVCVNTSTLIVWEAEE